MNTDDLIDFLATRVEAVDPGRQDRLLTLAMAGSLCLAAVACIFALGVRPDLLRAVGTFDFVLKVSFLATMVAIAAHGLRRAARAGRASGKLLRLALLPLALVWFAAVMQIVATPATSGMATMFNDWYVCVLAIPLLSVIPLVVLTLVLRETAPTDLHYCGALLGLVAGGIGALAYASFCVNDAPVYVGIWYAAGLAIVTGFGWLTGPRFLKW